MNIGIFGGTFNPIHNGHISLAEQLLRKGILDKILFMVSARPPHKDAPQVTAKARYEMVQLALKDKLGMEASDLELRRAGNSYTVDTMEAIRKEYPKDCIFFIMGADMFLDLPRWKEAERLFEEVSFIVSDRGGAFLDAEYQKKAKEIADKFNPKVQFVPILTPDISSTGLRADFKQQGLPAEVYAYIKRNHLYE